MPESKRVISESHNSFVIAKYMNFFDAIHGFVAIPIPSVDRGKCDPRNLVGVILSKDKENDHCKIGVMA